MSDANTAPAGPKWSSQFAFLMAAIGAAVGLGNLWRFPFQAGQNGGSAFVFVYLACVFLIAAPILIAEISVGRNQRKSAVGSPAALARSLKKTPAWGMIGFIGIFASFLVLTTYSVIAGQIMAFSLMGFLGEFGARSPDAALSLYSGPAWTIFWFSLFLLMNIIVVARDLRGGIEKIVTILMPVFFILIVGLAWYALTTGDAGAAIAYLFSPRFGELSPQVVLAAMGQAFYSLAVGAGAMITYGAFLDRKENIVASSGLIAGADTIVALTSGLMIFPVVFAFALDPAAGMGLIFNALPNVFAGMPSGAFIGGVFFFLAFIAALTSSISMLFVNTVLAGEWLGWSRTTASWIIGGAAWAIGVVGVFVSGMGHTIDFLAGSVFLPLSALLCAVFVGWVVPRQIMRDEMAGASEGVFSTWRFLVRWLCPIGVATILAFGIIAEFSG